MEYAFTLERTGISNDNFMRYVGYQDDNKCTQTYFSQDTVNLISYKVSELTMGVCSKKIIVTDRVINHVMSQIYSSYRPNTGSIYTRYNIPTATIDYVQDMIDRCIEFITNNITTQYGMIENNSKLSIWDTVLGDFNKQGLRSHDIIKIREKKPDSMMFFENY